MRASAIAVRAVEIGAHRLVVAAGDVGRARLHRRLPGHDRRRVRAEQAAARSTAASPCSGAALVANARGAVRLQARRIDDVVVRRRLGRQAQRPGDGGHGRAVGRDDERGRRHARRPAAPRADRSAPPPCAARSPATAARRSSGRQPAAAATASATASGAATRARLKTAPWRRDRHRRQPGEVAARGAVGAVDQLLGVAAGRSRSGRRGRAAASRAPRRTRTRRAGRAARSRGCGSSSARRTADRSGRRACRSRRRPPACAESRSPSAGA